MSVTINAKGTSVPTFTVGRNGTTVSLDGEITPPSGNDLVVNLDPANVFRVTSSTGDPGTITTDIGVNLEINPDGDLFLKGLQWPSGDGASGAILVTDGNGILSWIGSTPVDILVSEDTTTPDPVYPIFATGAGTVDLRYNTDLNFIISSGTVNATAFNTTSTQRVKKDIKDLGKSYLDGFSKLRPKEYDRRDYNDRHEFGFIAEDVALIYPEIVGLDSDGRPTGIDYSKLSAILTAKVQEQQKTIDELKWQVSNILEVINRNQ
jgi:hypothetical protein